MGENSTMDILYGTAAGRAVLKGLLNMGLPKAMAWYMHKPLSKPMIGRYIKKYNINMDSFEPVDYACFSDFFVRRKKQTEFDTEPSHLISPCDSLLSAFPISEDSVFGIKSSEYRVIDLVGDAALAQHFNGGSCLIFRLRAQDYHHYCFIDNAYVHENRFFEGQLHSVQPIACVNFPVYRINRRCCTVMDTDNFGTVAQIEVGAMAVGGIVNEYENCRSYKGTEMGRFELCGSTIVLLFERDRIKLTDELRMLTQSGRETPVTYGRFIGTRFTGE